MRALRDEPGREFEARDGLAATISAAARLATVPGTPAALTAGGGWGVFRGVAKRYAMGGRRASSGRRERGPDALFGLRGRGTSRARFDLGC